jgi:hypothetical protein
MQITIPELVTRLTKGSRLTTAEVDGNWTTIRNLLAQISKNLAVALNTDGTLRADAVATDDVQNRAISEAKLGWTALHAAEDTGGANALTVTFTVPMTELVDFTVLFIRARLGNTGASTLKVDAMEAKPVHKNGGDPVTGGEWGPGQVICVLYYNGAWHLVSGAGGSVGSTAGSVPSTGLRDYSGEAALPGIGSTAPFAHALAEIPTKVEGWLECVTAEKGYTQNERVPLDFAVTSTGLPAFTVRASRSNVVVQQHAAVYLTNQSNNASEEITDASWKLRVTAFRTYNTTGLVSAPVSLQVAHPEGAVGYGVNVFLFHRNRHSDVMHISRWNRNSNMVTRLCNIDGGNFAMVNATVWRYADGIDRVVWTSLNSADAEKTRIYHKRLDNADDPVQVANLDKPVGGTYNTAYWKPAYIDTSLANPTMYLVQSASHPDYTIGTTRALHARRLAFSAGAYSMGTWGDALDLHNTSIVDGDKFRNFHASNAAAHVLLFQYNPFKRRIYVITTGTGLMHIFNLSLYTSDNLGTWWTSANRETKLTYEKAIGLAGGVGTEWSSPAMERYCVEWDMVTGAEQSVVHTRIGNSNYTGTVVRAPWLEEA